MLKLPFIIIKRLIRFTPAFYFVYLMYWQLGPLLINGANFTVHFDRRFQDCDSNWWMDLLYIRNLMPISKQTMFDGSGACMSSSWYMDADLQVRCSAAAAAAAAAWPALPLRLYLMLVVLSFFRCSHVVVVVQLFLLIPLLAVVAFWSPRVGLVTMSIVCCWSWGLMTVLGVDRGWAVSALDTLNFWYYYWRMGESMLMLLYTSSCLFPHRFISLTYSLLQLMLSLGHVLHLLLSEP